MLENFKDYILKNTFLETIVVIVTILVIIAVFLLYRNIIPVYLQKNKYKLADTEVRVCQISQVSTSGQQNNGVLLFYYLQY